MIPSVKLDFSHIQSKCGSLDKVHYAAGGGNVSNSAESSSPNPFVSMLCHASCRVCQQQFAFFSRYNTALVDEADVQHAGVPLMDDEL